MIWKAVTFSAFTTTIHMAIVNYVGRAVGGSV